MFSASKYKFTLYLRMKKQIYIFIYIMLVNGLSVTNFHLYNKFQEEDIFNVCYVYLLLTPYTMENNRELVLSVVNKHDIWIQ